MTNKEKEKQLYNFIKSNSKKWSWKFKSYFIFKIVSNFFYETNFYFDPKNNRLWGWLAFKPYSTDNLFWEITNMKENQKQPLSFRADAAFKITSYNFFDFDITLKDFDDLEKEIIKLLSEIEKKIIDNTENINSIEKFLELSKIENQNNTVAILTTLIELERYDEAKKYIDFCRSNSISSGFGFGKKDYYDVAEDFIKKKTKRPFWNFFNN